MQANALDHVALWVADRDTLADFACRHLGMHLIERTEDFTLVGAVRLAKPGSLWARSYGPRELERAAARFGEPLPTSASRPSV